MLNVLKALNRTPIGKTLLFQRIVLRFLNERKVD